MPQTAAASITALLTISKKRSFLAESAISVILDIFDVMPRDCVSELITSHEDLRALLATPAEDSTPEALLLALHIWPYLPADVLSSCSVLPTCPGITPPVDLFSHIPATDGTTSAPASSKKGKASSAKNGTSVGANGLIEGHSQQRADAAAQFFSQGHLEKVGECLKLSSASTPHLHSVWPHVLRLLLPQFALKSPGKAKQKRDESGCVFMAVDAMLLSNMLCNTFIYLCFHFIPFPCKTCRQSRS